MARARTNVEEPATQTHSEQGAILSLGILSILVGAWTGLIVAMFRLGLDGAARLRETFLNASHHWSIIGFIVVVCTCTVVTVFAAWLARRFSPYTEGSGIPEVEVALQRKLPSNPLFRLLLIKFVGGLLAIGGGLALGPEGPGVQMGAVGARLIGNRFHRRWPDMHSLIAAGTGAGLAVAFNAPIAGAVFVLEELHRRFDGREALAALGASTTAILVARIFLGDAPLFHVTLAATGPLTYITSTTWPLFVVLGVIAGLIAAIYNRVLVGALTLAERIDRWPVRVQAAAVGALVGIIGWFAPDLIGAGDVLTQQILAGSAVMVAIPFVFVLRFLFGAASYGVRAPGGLFAPLLLLGAQVGLMYGSLTNVAFPGLEIQPQVFAVVGMVAFFAGVIRAPVTGIVLVIEMTAAFSTLLPMLAASFTAMVAADLTGIRPIYETLRERLLERVSS